MEEILKVGDLEVLLAAVVVVALELLVKLVQMLLILEGMVEMVYKTTSWEFLIIGVVVVAEAIMLMVPAQEMVD
jgi:hypothetical protein